MKRNLLTMLMLAGALCASRAGVILSDDFNYPDGGIVTNSTWITVSGTTPVLVANQELILAASRSEDIANFLADGPYVTNSSAKLYSSYKLKCVQRPTTVLGTYFSHFTGSNAFGFSGFRARVFGSNAKSDGTAAGTTQFYLGIVNAGGNVTNGVWPTALETNVFYTIVTRYVVATGESTLWVNPNAETDFSVTATDPLPLEPSDAMPTNGVLNIQAFGFRQASGYGMMIIDDLKIGTQFNDVAGANTAPLISPIPDQSIAGNANTGPLPFTVQDAETPSASLVVTATSLNPTLVPNQPANLTLGGSGSTRTLTVTPVAGQEGVAVIRVNVSDGINNSFTTFEVRVGFPTLSEIPNQIVKPSTSTGPIAFTVADAETGAGSLVPAATSSNPTLVSVAGITFGGSGANRTINVTPEPGQTGAATITVTITDGINTTGEAFVVTVSPVLGIVLSDAFSYPDGALWLNGPWSYHASPTGTNFSQMEVVSGTAQLTRSQAEDLAADLTGGPYQPESGAVLYTGFTVKFTELPSRSGNYFLHLKDTGTGTTFRAKVYGSTTNAAEGQYRLGIANSANTVSSQYPQDLSLENTYLVVTRYNSATAETRLWVNPVTEASPSVDATDSASPSIVGALGLRQDVGIGTNYIDNLVISSSFSDVLSSVPQPTPEPLLFSQVPGGIELKWNNPAFRLQAAPLVSGPYTNVPNAVSPFVHSTTQEQLYFRLKY